jgi:cytochrome P450
MREGDAILAVLAAANRDPAQNPEPDRFDPARKDRRLFTFGLGAHACPGAEIAATIAAAGVAALLDRGIDPGYLAKRATYRPSVNVRILSSDHRYAAA